MQYTVSMEDAANQYYHVVLECKTKAATLDFKMCAWTPGYYQILDYAKAVENFDVTDAAGKPIKWEKPSADIWHVYSNNESVKITYDVKAKVSFVGNIYLDETRGYITPGGLFLYLDQELRNPVTIQIKPYSKWTNFVATGLDSIPGKQNTFIAADFDVLYDSPFLMGELESLPPFTVNNIPHYFIGYKLGDFDRNQFMSDLKKIVVSGSNIIGDIPYTHYTFLAIGPGRGGIEHLNSTSLSFSGGEGFDSPDARKRLYSFIAHEYFHHYNVKRIRPIELGPFDYSKENRTNMLWVSEGFTVYYEYMILRRAGLMNDDDVFKAFQSNIQAYENKPGHLFQSATQASYDTWSDGPFGRTGDEINKTISYYDKGPVLGLMLDFSIRHATNNKKSLDDVMRLLYTKYYQTKKRGFTEKEFRDECEKMAGTSLSEMFDYASTVKPPNYPKYFAYAGLNIDTMPKALSGPWCGIKLKEKNDTLTVTEVDWNSPAWNKDVRAKNIILAVDGNKVNLEQFNKIMQSKNIGDNITLLVAKGNDKKEVTITLGQKFEKSFTITPITKPDALQTAIYKSWTGK
ncbi:M61 family metallopeptidase [Panacibacter ginsenosidivorans]|nr:PDZ domain-containing protein [Panacibacter ginsenosidivorans]